MNQDGWQFNIATYDQVVSPALYINGIEYKGKWRYWFTKWLMKIRGIRATFLGRGG